MRHITMVMRPVVVVLIRPPRDTAVATGGQGDNGRWLRRIEADHVGWFFERGELAVQ